MRPLFVAEEYPKAGNVAKEGHLGHRLRRDVLEQATQHDRFTVGDPQGRIDFTIRNDGDPRYISQPENILVNFGGNAHRADGRG